MSERKRMKLERFRPVYDDQADVPLLEPPSDLSGEKLPDLERMFERSSEDLFGDKFDKLASDYFKNLKYLDNANNFDNEFYILMNKTENIERVQLKGERKYRRLSDHPDELTFDAWTEQWDGRQVPLEQSPSDAEGLRIRASRIASEAGPSWIPFIPTHIRRILEPVLAVSAQDLLAELVAVRSLEEQDQLIRKFRMACVVEVFRCTWFAFLGPIFDGMHWVADRLPGK